MILSLIYSLSLEPILLASAEEVMKIQDQATEDFKKAQILIKEELIKDESISEEELEEVYLLRLEEVKKALEERAELQLKELEAKYIK